MRSDIKKVDLRQEFRICPTCGYRDGFHSMFKNHENEIQLFCICPSCHDIFDPNIKLNKVDQSGIK